MAMKIHGIMKMSLLDFPGYVAATVFLGGCDMRCPFCHNFELTDYNAPAIWEEADLFKFLDTRKRLLDGVAFTGGEPLLRKDLPEVIRKIREMGFKIKLDTNGNHPEKLIALVEEGLLDYVAMDIKNSPEKYPLTCGVPDFSMDNVRRSVDFLLSGKVPYEFRTTVVKNYHTREDMENIGKWISGADKYFLQGFVERDTVPVEGLSACSEEQMKVFLDIVKPYVKEAGLRGI